jgi:hypothetical protein
MPNIRNDMFMLKLSLAAASSRRDREIEVLGLLANDYWGEYETLIPYAYQGDLIKAKIGVWWFKNIEILVYIEQISGNHIIDFSEDVSADIQTVCDNLLQQHLRRKRPVKLLTGPKKLHHPQPTLLVINGGKA